MSEETKASTPKKGKGKLIIGAAGALVVLGGGGAAGAYFMGLGPFAAGGAIAAVRGPRLVPKSEEHRIGAGSEAGGGKATPAGEGGERYASNYYVMDKEFTSNLQDSVHFVQVGLAVSTPYDESVIDNLKTHEIAVRSAVLLELGNTSEDGVFTTEGKRQLQGRLTRAINNVLVQKEGFGGIGNVYFTSFVVQ